MLVGAGAERDLQRRLGDVALLAVRALGLPSSVFGSTVSCPTICGSSRLPLTSKVKVTSCSPVFSALTTFL